jgi:AraC family transcriptional regulator, transcriptional activator of pobA
MLNFQNFEIVGSKTIKTLKESSLIFIFIESGHINLQLTHKNNTEFSSGILFLNNKNFKDLVIQSTESKISIIEIDELFMSDYLVDINSLLKQYQFVKLDHEECFRNVMSLYKMMEYEIELNHLNTSIVNQLLKSVFAIYNSEIMKFRTLEDFMSPKNNLYITNLIKLIEDNYKKNHLADYYANELLISKRQLNNLSQKYFNTTLNNLIVKRKVNEAKLFLKESALQINEIGYELGFKEKSYFTRVFKSSTGVSPKEFRAQYLKVS